jgi:large subunit ribosomal protein L2
MVIKISKPCSPGTRNKSTISFDGLDKVKPQRNLTSGSIKSSNGRNNCGRITVRHIGGGHKQRYRIIDFKRLATPVSGRVVNFEYDPNRNAHIALINYSNGEKKYILAPRFLEKGTTIWSKPDAPIEIGNTLPLSKIPLGSFVHNVEIIPRQGGKIARSAGAAAQVIAKEGGFATLKLPSTEVRLIPEDCSATIGQVGNVEVNQRVFGKAGCVRWLGRRPTVRGVVMNPCDHPHGGGEGRSPIGRARPVTPWGKVALGVKTRRNKKQSDSYILRRRAR